MSAQPSFFSGAVLALDLGIGATTAIFTVINAVLLNPIPFSEPDRITCLFQKQSDSGVSEVSTPDFFEWRQRQRSFEAIGAARYENFNIADSNQPERVRASSISAGLFDVVGVKPIRGRSIRTEDEFATAGPVVVMGYSLWQRRYGGDESVLGRSIRINGRQYTVIGIMPPRFEFPNSGLSGSELWAPLVPAPEDLSDHARRRRQLMVFGRLRQTVTLAQAQAEMDVLARQIAAQHPATNANVTAIVQPLAEQLRGGQHDLLYALLGTVGCVFLIACANVANLVIARSNARRREIAVRSALGASQSRLVAQLIAESSVLAVTGLVLGIVIAYFARDLLSTLAPPMLVGQRELGLNLPVLSFSVLLCVSTLVLFGLAPAIAASRVDVRSVLNEGGRHPGGTASSRLRSGLVVVEIALSMFLLTTAAALIRTFYDVLAVSPGFQSDHLLSMRVALPQEQYATGESKVAFHDRLIERASAVPGVKSVVATNSAPLRDEQERRYYVAGGPRPESGREPRALFHAVSAGYFETLGIKVEAGRPIEEYDREGSEWVAVVNTSAAKRVLGGVNAVGQSIVILNPSETERMAQIVGVVSDVRHYGPLAESPPQIYVPYRQFPTQRMDLLARTQVDPASTTSAMRQAVASLDRDLPLFNAATMDHLLDEAIRKPKFSMLLVGALAGIALVLALIGVAGVLTYLTSLRRREIAIRSALGADGRRIRWLFVRHGGMLGGTGILLGSALSFAFANVVSGLLFGIRSIDLFVAGAAGLILMTAVLAASILPAIRAAKVDPMAVLRSE
jgi:putative ABC transport system permease protein